MREGVDRLSFAQSGDDPAQMAGSPFSTGALVYWTESLTAINLHS
jgi:hypothetical protein